MKWSNKGHEFDSVYKEIEQKKHYYLFGAGDYGRQFLNIFKDEIEIAGFIDNDKEKQRQGVVGMECLAIEDILYDDDIGIIITMSQIARVKPMQQLSEAGYIKHKDFFVIEEFLSVYFVYCREMVYFSSISFLPSTACNLNCCNCLNFNPFAKRAYVRRYEDLINDIDLFFSCVDRIMLFHLSGGEPMLYPRTADLLLYLRENYGDRIDTLRTVTNGTVVPSDETLEKLSRCDIDITVDDYRTAVPNSKDKFDLLLAKLSEYSIRHYVNKYESWIDLAPEKTDYSSWTEEQMTAHRDRCSQSWQELRGGRLYNCNYAAYATVAGIAGEQDTEETFDLPCKESEMYFVYEMTESLLRLKKAKEDMDRIKRGAYHPMNYGKLGEYYYQQLCRSYAGREVSGGD